MKLFILPGFSPSNKDWAQNLQKQLTGVDCQIIYWRHWTNEIEENWLDCETQRIIESIGSEKIIILAKSIGTAIAMKVLNIIPNNIDKIILCGIPLNDFSPGNESLYKPLVDYSANNIIVFQNDNDPHGSFAKIQTFVQNLNLDIPVVSKPSNDHEYPYPEDFLNFIYGKR